MNPEARIPATHPLRAIKRFCDEALHRLSPLFDELYSAFGRTSIPPEQLLQARVLISPYSVRSAKATRDIHIGSGQDDGRNFFWVGRIDDVGLFRKAMSEAEVQQVMSGGVDSLGTPPPSAPFVITSFTGGPATGSVTLTWNSTPGANYRVAQSTSLNLNEWTNSATVIPSGGATTSFTLPTLPPSNTSVYYRVVLVQ